MKKKIIILTIMFLTLLMLAPVVCSALDDEYSRATLRGLRALHLTISLTSDIEAKKNWITKDELRTTVELRLRLAGINAVSAKEAISMRDAAGLFLTIIIMEVGKLGVYAYSIHLELGQMVSLERNPDIEYVATTWSENMLGIAGQERTSTVMESVKKKVAKFINAYLSVNPKRE